ncbi:hypothetical protein Trydic_g9487 [Trypoxylus dichotomus]
MVSYKQIFNHNGSGSVWSHALTDDVTADIEDHFVEDLADALDTVGNRIGVVLMGDFNARIGKKVGDQIVGQHGEDVVNDNGTQIIEVCHRYDLKVMNSFFNYKEVHKYYVISTHEKSTGYHRLHR